MKRTLLTLVVTIVVVLLIRALAFTSCTIPSSGMENTLFRGDRVIVNLWSYGLRLPFMKLWGYHRMGGEQAQKGDIILFNNPDPKYAQLLPDQREVFINRGVGLPGDTLMLNSELMITVDEVVSPDDKLLYSYPGSKEDLLSQALANTCITDNVLLGYDKGNYVRSFCHFEFYLLQQELQGKIPFK